MAHQLESSICSSQYACGFRSESGHMYMYGGDREQLSSDLAPVAPNPKSKLAGEISTLLNNVLLRHFVFRIELSPLSL